MMMHIPEPPMLILPLPKCPWCGEYEAFGIPDPFFLIFECKFCGNNAIRMAATGAYVKCGDKRPPIVRHNDIPIRAISVLTQVD
jgi:hypothetical protein